MDEKPLSIGRKPLCSDLFITGKTYEEIDELSEISTVELVLNLHEDLLVLLEKNAQLEEENKALKAKSEWISLDDRLPVPEPPKGDK